MRAGKRRIRIAAVIEQQSGFAQTLLSGIARWLSEHPRSGVSVTKLQITEARLGLLPYDGVIYHGGVPAFEARMRRYKRPAINTSANSPYVPANSILSDDVAAARLAIEHLIEHGRQDLAVLRIVGPLYHQQRHAAFAKVAREMGLAVTTLSLPDDPPDSGWRSLVRQVRDRAGALGIFTTDNQLGDRLCAECTAAGIPVPEDVAIVGLGNETNLCEFATPPLSAVDSAMDLRGYHAINEMVAQVNGKPPLAQPMVIAPRGVIVRSSSDLTAVRDPDVRAALRFIHDHADGAVRIEEVVRFAGISRRSLEQKFRQHLSRTIHEEIWRSHLQLARHLLVHSDLPLYHVAARSGYGTLSNFSTLFRRATGMAPNEYRRITSVRR